MRLVQVYLCKSQSEKRAAKPHLVVVAELLGEGGLDGLGRRAVTAARVAHEDEHLLRRLGPRRGLLHLAYPIHIPSAPSAPAAAAGVTPAIAAGAGAETQAQGREPERRYLVPVQPHEARELAPHLVEPRRRGGSGARDGDGDGERAGPAARGRAREEGGGMVGGGRGGGGGARGAGERRGEERGRDAQEGRRERRLGGRRGHRGEERSV